MRELTVYYIYDGNICYAMIRVQGKWLEKLGFKVGNKIVVEEIYNRLIISIQEE